jgi:short-subunit dehydrogenase
MSMDGDVDESVAGGVARIVGEHDRLDAIVTAAGWGLSGSVEDTPIDSARAQVETNFWGTVRVVREVLPVMRNQGHGQIVLMGSIGGLLGLPFQSYYSASKFALEGFAEALAYEVAPFGVSVTIIEPGNVATSFTSNRHKANADAGPYARLNTSAVAAMEREERNGIDAEQVAHLVHRVLESKNPPRRVSVGKLDERFGAFAKRLLPYRVFERIARGPLGV